MSGRSDDRTSRPGLLARLFRRRGARTGPDRPIDHGVQTVDHVVRVLAAACQRENRDLPSAHMLVIGRDTALFRLGTPDERPPDGWAAEHDGRTWHAPLERLRATPVPGGATDPFPRLVPFGDTSEGFVLLNLDEPGGVIALEGDARQAGTLAREWTTELTTNPWSRAIPVVRVGFPPDTEPPPPGTIEAITLPDVEPTLASELAGVLVLSEAPAGRDAERLRALDADPDRHWSVVVVGIAEQPRWRFTVGADGAVRTGLLDEPVIMRSGTAVPPPLLDKIPADAATRVAAGPTVVLPAEPPQRLLTRSRVVGTLIVAAVLVLAAAALMEAPTITRALGATEHTRKSPSPSPSPSSPSPSPSHSPSPSPSPSRTTEPPPAPPPPTHASPPPPQDLQAGGTGIIRNPASGMCVDSDSNPAMMLNDKPEGGHAFSNPCNGAPTEQWQEGGLLSQDSPRAPDMFRIVDKSTGFCLDSGSNGIYTLPCLDPDQYQSWQRIPLGPMPNGGTFIGYRDIGTGKCLSISPSDRTLTTADCPGSGAAWPDNLKFRRPK